MTPNHGHPMTRSLAWRQGLAARRGDDPEPRAPYEPGTPSYTEFADGYCFDPWPDTLLSTTGARIQRAATEAQK